MDPNSIPRPLPPSNPEFLGPLDGAAPSPSGPTRLFPGEAAYFSKRQLAARERIGATVAPRVVPLLEEGEQILHVAPACHIPSLLHQLGLGWWWYHFYRVALVVTDRRIVEVLLDHRRRLDARLLSYRWSAARALTLRFGALAFRPRTGRVQKWRLERADRKLLRRLLPLIVQRRLDVSGEPAPGAPPSVPRWHCPACAADLPAKAPACAACGARFTSPRLATWLSVAVPGGGLFYTGHPVLGAFDLIGELMLALLVVVMLLTSPDAATTIGAIVVGLVLLLVTKLESVHLARLFASRTRLVTEARAGAWRRLAPAGAAVSILTIALPLPFVGALVNRIDRDLTFAGAQPTWTGGFESAKWRHGADADQRSEWIREDGQTAFVFAYPLGPGEGLEDLREELNRRELAEPVADLAIARFSGLRAVQRVQGERGAPLWQLQYFLLDEEMRDLHVVLTYAEPGAARAAEQDLRALLSAAEWTPTGR